MSPNRSLDDLPSEILFRICQHLANLLASPPASPLYPEPPAPNPWLFSLPPSTTPGIPITPLGPIASTSASRRDSTSDGYFGIGLGGPSGSRRPSVTGMSSPGGGSPYHSQASSYSFGNFLTAANASAGFLVPPVVGSEPPFLSAPIGMGGAVEMSATPVPVNGFRIPSLPSTRAKPISGGPTNPISRARSAKRFNPFSIPAGIRILSLVNQKLRGGLWPYMIRRMVIEGEVGAREVLGILQKTRSKKKEEKRRKGIRAAEGGVGLFAKGTEDDEEDMEVLVDGTDPRETDIHQRWTPNLRGRVESLLINIYLPITPLPTPPAIDLLLSLLAPGLRKLEIRFVDGLPPSQGRDGFDTEGGGGYSEQHDLGKGYGTTAREDEEAYITAGHARETTDATVRQPKQFENPFNDAPARLRPSRLTNEATSCKSIYLPFFSNPSKTTGTVEPAFLKLIDLRVTCVDNPEGPCPAEHRGQIINLDGLVSNAPNLREFRLEGWAMDVRSGLRVVGALQRSSSIDKDDVGESEEDEDELAHILRARSTKTTNLGQLEVLQLQLRGSDADGEMIKRLVCTALGDVAGYVRQSRGSEVEDRGKGKSGRRGALGWESKLRHLDIDVKGGIGAMTGKEWSLLLSLVNPHRNLKSLSLPLCALPAQVLRPPKQVSELSMRLGLVEKGWSESIVGKGKIGEEKAISSRDVLNAIGEVLINGSTTRNGQMDEVWRAEDAGDADTPQTMTSAMRVAEEGKRESLGLGPSLAYDGSIKGKTTDKKVVEAIDFAIGITPNAGSSSSPITSTGGREDCRGLKNLRRLRFKLHSELVEPVEKAKPMIQADNEFGLPGFRQDAFAIFIPTPIATYSFPPPHNGEFWLGSPTVPNGSIFVGGSADAGRVNVSGIGEEGVRVAGLGRAARGKEQAERGYEQEREEREEDVVWWIADVLSSRKHEYEDGATGMNNIDSEQQEAEEEEGPDDDGQGGMLRRLMDRIKVERRCL